MPQRRKLSKRRRPQKMGVSRALKPPQFQSVPTIRTCMRFINQTAQSGNATPLAVTTINLMNAAGLMATGANTAYPFHGFFEIIRIELWSSLNSSVSFNQAPTIGVRWFNTVTGTLGDTNSQDSDSTINPSAPAYVSSRPPKGTAASWWSGPSTNTIFNIFFANTTAIICDIHCDLKINDNANNTVTSVTTTNAMTVGNVYFPALDGVSGNQWRRTNLPQIA